MNLARIFYWRQGESSQNFGDYLAEYFLDKALLGPRIVAGAYHLLGSTLDEGIISADRAQLEAEGDGQIAFWGCGIREDKPFPADLLDGCLLFGVRGPLTRDLLNLPQNTVLGDPGLLVPLFHERKPSELTKGKAICVPHFWDTKTDENLLALTGAQRVVRPANPSSIEAIQSFIDSIADARFVLTASLHATIIAFAYNVPFAFWDNGFMDFPFKWQDFAASIGLSAMFVTTVQEGEIIYREVISPKAKKLPLLPILQNCPFYVRPSVLVRALGADDIITDDAADQIAAVLEQTAFESPSYTEEALGSIAVLLQAIQTAQGHESSLRATVDEQRQHIEALHKARKHARDLLGKVSTNYSGVKNKLDDCQAATSDLTQRLQERESYIQELLQSESWRITSPLRYAIATLKRLQFQSAALLGGVWDRFQNDQNQSTCSSSGIHLPKPIRSWFPVKVFSPLPDDQGSQTTANLPSDISSSMNERALTNAATIEGKADRMPENWILMVEWRIPMPENNSASVRLFQILRILLQKGYRIFFISDQSLANYHSVLSDISGIKPHEEHLQRLGVNYLYGRDSAIEHLRQCGARYRHVLLFYPDIANYYTPWIRSLCPQARIVFDSVDLHFLRFEREAQVKNDLELRNLSERYHRIETLLFECCDVTVAISEEEKAIIHTINPYARVEVLQNIHEIYDRPAPIEARRNLMFIGHYLHSPNVDAVKYFVTEIFPSIRAAIRDIEFLVVGSNPTKDIQNINIPGVRLVGFVEDLRPLFDTCRVFVAPLRYGGGVKGKIGQSLSFGLPVVTTSIGAEGMHLKNDETALIADRPEDFAEAVVRLYRDTALWEQLSRNGLRHIQNTMSVQAAAAQIDRILADPLNSNTSQGRMG